MTRRLSRSNLPQLLLKAREHFLSHFRPILNHFGLTEQQWRIIRAVNQHEQLEPREICQICHIMSPSLAGVLARMEEMELVTRTRILEDQRRVLIRLTPKSEDLVEVMVPLIEKQYCYLEQAFGIDLINQLYEVLDKVVVAEPREVQHVDLPKK